MAETGQWKRPAESTAEKTKAPQAHLGHGTPVEQPSSPEVCSQPPYVLTCTERIARTGYLAAAVVRP
jgi:hypothetical protein